MITHSGHIKLTDFGFSKIIHNKYQIFVHTDIIISAYYDKCLLSSQPIT